MNRIFLIRHKKLNCAYVRSVSGQVDLETKPASLFTPLRNCLTQHITSRASPERKKIYAYLKDNNLFMEPTGVRNMNWTEDWHAHLWHDNVESEEEVKQLSIDLCNEVEEMGIMLLNSRTAR